MNITVDKNGENLTINVEGRIDANTSNEFMNKINENLEGAKNVVIDFEKVEYISSAGLRVLLSTEKTMKGQGKLTLIHVNDVVMEVLNITGFVDILNISTTSISS